MKSLSNIVLSTVLILALCSCGGGSSGSKQVETSTSSASSMATSSSSSKRSSSSSSSVPMVQVVVNGMVTGGAAIANADVAFTVGKNIFTTTADAGGKYSLALNVGLADADTLVKASAKGKGEQIDVVFTSVLPSVNTLIQQAGSDKTLDSNENFNVNITNITTAESALFNSDLLEADLELSPFFIDPSVKIQIAALIKIIVDKSQPDWPYNLTRLFEFDFASVSSSSDEKFLKLVSGVDSVLLAKTIASINADANLVKPANNNLSVLANITDVNLAKCVNASGATSLLNVTTLNCKEMMISSLTGLSNLTNLRSISIASNNFIGSGLDLSANTKLKILIADNNDLTNVNVSANTELFFLSLNDNRLKSIDVSKNLNLTRLAVENNQLSQLDISKNTKLQVLGVADNDDLKTLDTSILPDLKTLWTCGNNFISLDVSKNLQLDTFCIPNTPINIDLGKNTKIKTLVVFNTPISLDVSKMIELESLYVFSNDNVQAIDLSKNTKLKSAVFWNCSLTSIDFSKNTKLTYIDVSSNQLKSISGLEFIEDKSVEANLTGNPFSAEALSYLNNVITKNGFTNIYF